MSTIFDVVYKRKRWGEGSGPGSTIESTKNIVPYIINIIKEKKINKIVDGSCGACEWMPLVLNKYPNIIYIGNDISDVIIKINQEKFKDKPKWKFYTKDLINEDIESCDLFICRDTMMHLNIEDNIKVLNNIKKNTKYALLSNFQKVIKNPEDNTRINFYNDINIKGGYVWKAINLNIEPFNLNINNKLEEIIDKYEGMQMLQLYKFN
jgi:hypothetical protein